MVEEFVCRPTIPSAFQLDALFIGRLSIRWKKTQAMGAVYRRRRVGDIELFVDVRDMGINSAVANTELAGDLLFYATFSKQLDDFQLPLGKLRLIFIFVKSCL